MLCLTSLKDDEEGKNEVAIEIVWCSIEGTDDCVLEHYKIVTNWDRADYLGQVDSSCCGVRRPNGFE